MQFLMPCDYFQKYQPDELFKEQAIALQAAGHSIHCFDSEALGQTSRILPVPGTEAMLYRGFMLEPEQYKTLAQLVAQKGSSLLVSLEMYLSCHYLPNWYDKLAGLTPETLFFDSIEAALTGIGQLDWPGYFLKDHVKSLKTGPGAIASSGTEAELILTEMQNYRGRIEGGICVRRVEKLLPETETRYFVYQQQIFAPQADQAIPEIVKTCRDRIDSLFFSVDMARNSEGQDRIVEIGDGQVSDITGWTAERFAEIFGEAES